MNSTERIETWVRGHLITTWTPSDVIPGIRPIRYFVTVDRQPLLTKDGRRQRWFHSRVAAHQAGLRRVREMREHAFVGFVEPAR